MPLDREINVSPGSEVSVTFSSGLQESTVNKTTVSLWGEGSFGAFRVPGGVLYDEGSATIFFRHAGLVPDAWYTLQLSGVTDAGGKPVGNSKITFATKPSRVIKSTYFQTDGSVRRYSGAAGDLASWKEVDYTSSGIDGLWFTPDDTILQYREHFNLGSFMPWTHYYNDPGPDGIWFSPDDNAAMSNSAFYYQVSLVPWAPISKRMEWASHQYQDLSSYSKRTYDADGQLMRIIDCDDGCNDDFVVSDQGLPTSYIQITRNADHLVTRETSYSRPGNDGIWFTSDDEYDSYVTYTYGETGLKVRETSYDADNLVSQTVVHSHDTWGLLRRTVFYGSAGPDGEWFTGDDVPIMYWDYTYDNDDNTKTVNRYGTPGPDGVWFTGDDVVLGTSDYATAW